MKTKTDLQFERHGSIILITAQSAQGKQWIKDNVVVPDYMQLGRDTIACEHRYAWDIARGAMSQGLTCV